MVKSFSFINLIKPLGPLFEIIRQLASCTYVFVHAKQSQYNKPK
jgi:hypothetical protein